jgi:hypothetical protein
MAQAPAGFGSKSPCALLLLVGEREIVSSIRGVPLGTASTRQIHTLPWYRAAFYAGLMTMSKPVQATTRVDKARTPVHIPELTISSRRLNVNPD